MVSIRTGGVSNINLVSLDGLAPNVSPSIESLRIQPTAAPPSAHQPVLTFPEVHVGDGRILNAVVYRDKIWLTFVDAYIPAGDSKNRACPRLIEIDHTTKSVIQNFDVATNNSYLFFPAIGLDMNGNMLMVYGFSSDQVYPSLAVSGKNSDPTSTMQKPISLNLGNAPEAGAWIAGHGWRYGDYFSLSLNPF